MIGLAGTLLFAGIAIFLAWWYNRTDDKARLAQKSDEISPVANALTSRVNLNDKLARSDTSKSVYSKQAKVVRVQGNWAHIPKSTQSPENIITQYMVDKSEGNRNFIPHALKSYRQNSPSGERQVANTEAAPLMLQNWLKENRPQRSEDGEQVYGSKR